MSTKTHLTQFLSVDSKHIRKDSQFWLTMLDGLLQFYNTTCVESDEHKEIKAVVCAKLAGLGLAIHQHFAAAVESLDCDDNNAVQQAGMKSYDIGQRHSRNMERIAKERLN